MKRLQSYLQHLTQLVDIDQHNSDLKTAFVKCPRVPISGLTDFNITANSLCVLIIVFSIQIQLTRVLMHFAF